LVRARAVVLRITTPFEASLTLVKRAGEAASIRKHPKRTSTMKHIVDSALAVSIILVDPKMAGPYILAVSLGTARTSVGGGESNGQEI
jgi:hypothetical protein